MVGRHCPPNRHGLSTSYRGRGNSRGGGVRWVDVSGAEWRLKREGSGGRLLSLHGTTHGGVKHGETVRMIDGILRRCRHAMGVYSPLPFAGELDLCAQYQAKPPLFPAPRCLVGCAHVVVRQKLLPNRHR
ncbi:hypothetical protein K0M31_020288 [Melipona bicolor]|uniref:Uncharacterized protein n=1 Tax=Melipona bicolor TaxID=60889 RepID=A0AA40G1C2_9HYME|nr:hypothetical protein K0M31_020288 [Melipona bicolor]